jgi:hypothetical protein
MKAVTNSTVISGKLLSCVPAKDGYGSHVEIEVASNESHSPSADFIKPEAGKTLRAFFAPQPALDTARTLVGRDIKATLTYLSGPSGGQAVVQQLEVR